jgi:hypothetical protein
MNLHSPLLLIHISGAVVGLLSGFLAMFLRKGSGLHGAAGNVFGVAMLAMSATGAYIAAFYRPNMANVVVALLTFYLVSTGWRAARRREGRPGLFDLGALLFILGDGLAAFGFGIQEVVAPRDNMPPALYFIFGSVALLCALTDIRMFRRGGLVGKQRMVRHLWRMSLALLIGALSFYPGQAKLFPMWLRETRVLLLPMVFVIGAMLYWRFRMRTRKTAAEPRSSTAVPLVVAHR